MEEKNNIQEEIRAVMDKYPQLRYKEIMIEANRMKKLNTNHSHQRQT